MKKSVNHKDLELNRKYQAEMKRMLEVELPKISEEKRAVSLYLERIQRLGSKSTKY